MYLTRCGLSGGGITSWGLVLGELIHKTHDFMLVIGSYTPVSIF